MNNCERKKYSEVSKYMIDNNINFPVTTTHKSLCKSVMKFDTMIRTSNKNKNNTGVELKKDEEIDMNEFRVYKDKIREHNSSAMRRLLKLNNDINNRNFSAFKKLNDEITDHCKIYGDLKNDDSIKKFINIIGNEDGIEYLYYLECLVKNIFATVGEKITSDNMGSRKLKKEFFTYFRPIEKLAEGADGVVYSSGLLGKKRKGNVPIFIIKMPKGDEKRMQTQIHEVVISRVLQEMVVNKCNDEDNICRPEHNYMYSFGGFFADIKRGDFCTEDPGSSTTKKCSDTVFLSLFEYIPGIDFQKAMNKMPMNKMPGMGKR